jgi:hypothetical protein
MIGAIQINPNSYNDLQIQMTSAIALDKAMYSN